MATDPYTQCGFKKLICISRIDEFLIHHLPNKYVGTSFGVDKAEFQRQLQALGSTASNGCRPGTLFQNETRLRDGAFSKSYYEPARTELLGAIPVGARKILSIGCGSGETEEQLVARGIHVVGIPLDAVIAGAAEAKGIEIVNGSFEEARKRLAGQLFDVLLFSNVLHLLPDPAKVLKSFAELLKPHGAIVISSPNLKNAAILWGRLRYDARFEGMDGYERSGVQATSHGEVRKWLRSSGLKSVQFTDLLTPRRELVSRYTLGIADPFLSSEFIAVATRQ